MERLKGLVPENLKQMISESSPGDTLSHCCSLLLRFFHDLPFFHQVLEDLVASGRGLCSKNMTSASDLKAKANKCFSLADFPQALTFYSQALRLAPMRGDGVDKEFLATIFVNRATTLHKLGLLNECIRDCNRAIALSPSYVKAWYRRGKAHASLNNYEDVVHDLNVALSLEDSLSRRSQIIQELQALSNHSTRKSAESKSHTKAVDNNLDSLVESDGVRLQCVSTLDKGRGMTSLHDIPPACLIHSEEPYAVIILKHCRESHCHFCFNELPVDSIPCTSCTIPLYCSEYCEEQAGGGSKSDQYRDHKHENTVVDLQRRIAGINLSGDAGLNENFVQLPEHRHECGGCHWPVVLPPDIVLAGRILAKSMQKRNCGKTFIPLEELELNHNYTHMPSECKLELHIYSIVLVHCLQDSFGVQFPLTGASASQLVILIAQIKINSMAIVHMKSSDARMTLEQSGLVNTSEKVLTSYINQVRVGQAIYLAGCLFNHSCQPNIHAYFISRKLCMRSTEFVPKECPLELSYGPQVGQLDFHERQQELKEQYSFKCNCCACSKQNVSDLVIHAFRCVNPNCLGVVTPFHRMKDERLEVQKWEREAIDEVAHLLNQAVGNGTLEFSPGYCLSCGSYRDLPSLYLSLEKAQTTITRFQNELILKTLSASILSEALESLDLFRLMMHAYSKDIAQVEDNLAEAFCLLGEFEAAMHHCKASVEILQRLYHSNHIAIGNELMKLASIQLSSNDNASAFDSIKQADAIFSLHYGPHRVKLFPFLDDLKKIVPII